MNSCSNTLTNSIEIMFFFKMNELFSELFIFICFKMINYSLITRYLFWHRDVVAIANAYLHSAKLDLRFCVGSNPTCGVSKACGSENVWQWSWVEIRLNTFCRSTISQKQFIIIIMISLLQINWILVWIVFLGKNFIFWKNCCSLQ